MSVEEWLLSEHLKLPRCAVKEDNAPVLLAWLENKKGLDTEDVYELFCEATNSEKFSCARVLLKHPLLPLATRWNPFDDDLEDIVTRMTETHPVKKAEMEKFIREVDAEARARRRWTELRSAWVGAVAAACVTHATPKNGSKKPRGSL